MVAIKITTAQVFVAVSIFAHIGQAAPAPGPANAFGFSWPWATGEKDVPAQGPVDRNVLSPIEQNRAETMHRPVPVKPDMPESDKKLENDKKLEAEKKPEEEKKSEMARRPEADKAAPEAPKKHDMPKPAPSTDREPKADVSEEPKKSRSRSRSSRARSRSPPRTIGLIPEDLFRQLDPSGGSVFKPLPKHADRPAPPVQNSNSGIPERERGIPDQVDGPARRRPDSDSDSGLSPDALERLTEANTQANSNSGFEAPSMIPESVRMRIPDSVKETLGIDLAGNSKRPVKQVPDSDSNSADSASPGILKNTHLNSNNGEVTSGMPGFLADSFKAPPKGKPEQAVRFDVAEDQEPGSKFRRVPTPHPGPRERPPPYEAPGFGHLLDKVKPEDDNPRFYNSQNGLGRLPSPSRGRSPSPARGRSPTPRGRAPFRQPSPAPREPTSRATSPSPLRSSLKWPNLTPARPPSDASLVSEIWENHHPYEDPRVLYWNDDVRSGAPSFRSIPSTFEREPDSWVRGPSPATSLARFRDGEEERQRIAESEARLHENNIERFRRQRIDAEDTERLNRLRREMAQRQANNPLLRDRNARLRTERTPVRAQRELDVPPPKVDRGRSGQRELDVPPPKVDRGRSGQRRPLKYCSEPSCTGHHGRKGRYDSPRPAPPPPPQEPPQKKGFWAGLFGN